MKKINILWLILDSIFLIIFNTFYFMLGQSPRPFSVWISYGFIHIAYALLLLSPLFVRKSKSAAVFGFSIYSIASVYFLIELAIGLVFILLKQDGFKIALLVQLSIMAIYAVCLLVSMIANEHTAQVEEPQQIELDYVKHASAALLPIMRAVRDQVLIKKIEKVYDAMKSSPVKSHTSVRETEQRIITDIDKLQNIVKIGDIDAAISLCSSLSTMIDERNSELKKIQVG